VHITIVISTAIILNIMRTIYVLHENKTKKQHKTLERHKNRDILLGQPTLTTGRGIKSSAIFVQSTQQQHKARDERRGKKKCRRRHCWKREIVTSTPRMRKSLFTVKHSILLLSKNTIFIM
jgi:hypothetical protein